jgi:hypothetical protein
MINRCRRFSEHIALLTVRRAGETQLGAVWIWDEADVVWDFIARLTFTGIIFLLILTVKTIALIFIASSFILKLVPVLLLVAILRLVAILELVRIFTFGIADFILNINRRVMSRWTGPITGSVVR